ncbi:MAG: hypothetical protein AMJ92_09665 [candidate division Zixibacteria bacterium SM23_81]|nr:MAG: hypothetical protein AMJ92_09665 [candidate division Zixibacteria bacterium SM23_81]
MITIDGSYGEGGGQILRTSLAISSVLGQELEIVNIRARRKKSGLMPQHLTACRAVADITEGKLEGAQLESTKLRYFPKVAQPGRYRFDVSQVKSSAGSTGMIFQTILPVLALAQGSSEVTLLGGTHTPWSPPIDYLQEVFLLAIARLGFRAQLSCERWGWYPRGGGVVRGRVEPARRVSGCDFSERGSRLSLLGLSVVSRLPLSIAQRQRDQALRGLHREGLSADIEVSEVPSVAPGTFIILLARFEKITAGFSALGRRGKPAETVADEAVAEMLAYLRAPGAVDPHLADQLVLYMTLAHGVSRLTTTSISGHLLTNVWVLEQFLPGRLIVEGNEGEAGAVVVKGIGLPGDRAA